MLDVSRSVLRAVRLDGGVHKVIGSVGELGTAGILALSRAKCLDFVRPLDPFIEEILADLLATADRLVGIAETDALVIEGLDEFLVLTRSGGD